jgi:hypothetical protein
MDWLENLFGLNLDGGDGSAEAIIVLALVIVLASAVGMQIPVVRARLRALLTRTPISS